MNEIFIHSIPNFETRSRLFGNNLLTWKDSINSWFGQMTNMLIQDKIALCNSLIFQTHRQIRDFTAFKKIWILTKMFFLFHFDKKWIITSYLKKIGNPFKLGREMKRQWSKYEKYKTRLASEAGIAISIFGCLLFRFRFKWTYLAKTSSQAPHIHSVSFPKVKVFKCQHLETLL